MEKNLENLSFKAGKSKSIFLGIAVLGFVLSGIGLATNHSQFAFSLLTSYLFYLSIALGGLFFVLIQHLTRAGWSVVVRRIAENVTANLQWAWVPLLILIPFALFGDHPMFHWAAPGEHDAIIQAKHAYLNKPFFLIRTVVFAIVWIVLTRFLILNSIAQDKSGDHNITLTLQKWSTLGIVLYGFSETFFTFDWSMSLNPHWFSTIYGVYFFSCSAVSIFCVLIIVSYLLRRNGYLGKTITVEHYHDMGKLMYGFNCFWAYIAFCQFLLIWYTNLGEETIFFHARAVGSWKSWGIALVFIHFVIPFVLLMSRNVKRYLPALFAGAIWILASNFMDIYWLVMPTINPKGVHFTLTSDLGCFLLLGGLFGYLLVNRMQKSSLIPEKDPRLDESLHFTNA